MPDEQQSGGGAQEADQQQKGGQIGAEVAEELKGKISIDEQRKLDGESDENYDAQFQQHLVAKLKPEIAAFNEKAEFADALQMKSDSELIRFFRDNKPAFALLIRSRQLHFLDPESPAPVASLQITGGPDEYFFHGGTGQAAPMDEAQALKGLVRLAAGGTFEAE